VGTAYTAADWSDLFVASAGASAALTGLLFVAVSVNIRDILKYEGLPARALQTLLLLLSAVVVSLVGLIPGQSTSALGGELLAIGLAFGGWILVLAARALEPTRQYVRPLFHFGLVIPGTLPLIVGAMSLLAQSGGGLYWIVGALLGALLCASVNAWVLLVEILR
jgi:modulator of FtsH protease